jgi:hypothetical protein
MEQMDLTTQLGRLVVAMSLTCAMPAVASADWYQDGVVWKVTPSGSSVGDCFGNCGAGCNSFANPCGGPGQYWEMQFLAGPDLVGTVQRASCTPGESGNEYYEEVHEKFQAIGRWTYHGHVTPGCIAHDFHCNGWLIGCVLWTGCLSPSWQDEWSYDEWMVGLRMISREYMGGC